MPIWFNIFQKQNLWQKIGMSDKMIEEYGKGYLVLLLPVSFLIVFLVATWRIWVTMILLVLGIKVWQRYQWESWCQKVNPLFGQIVYENQGKITPIDLAARCNFPGNLAKRYLDTKAEEFGVIPSKSNDGNQIYYFLNTVALSSIFDNSEPNTETESDTEKVPAALLSAPLIEELTKELEEIQLELKQAPQEKETKLTLEENLLFGSLIQSELAKRLNVYSSTIYKHRNDPDFSEWTRNRDPDGMSWVYSPETKEFFPEEEIN